MQRQNRKRPTALKAPVKQSIDDGKTKERTLEAAGPFVTFAEWSSEADEKAYTQL
jgi:hypothetical protein